jgi:homocysteine S-methyltransferase
MGTELYACGIPYEQSLEYQNVLEPTLVERIHRAYLEAGAQILETNTFGANALRLGQYGLGDKVHVIARVGARIARAAREAAGVDALVAGSVGPLGTVLEPYSAITLAQARMLFRQQIEALLEGGVDLLMIETFSDLREITAAIMAAREVCDLPIVAQMTFTEELLTPSGQAPEYVVQALEALGVDVIGVNCSVGPQSTLQIVEHMAQVTHRPLSAQPNAGLPAKVAGRLVYLTSPDYMADYALRMIQAGAKLVGGCCGTTPAHIGAVARRLQQRGTGLGASARKLAPVVVPDAHADAETHDTSAATSPFIDALQRRCAISVELRPPRGVNPAKVVAGATVLQAAGVDALNLTDGAMARVRMSTMVAGFLVKNATGLDPILHITTRDRNLMALQADLIGLHALGMRHVLALTGDPPATGDNARARGVYDVDSIGLIRLLRGFNRGLDVAGNSIGRPTSFVIGAALTLSAPDLELELDRFQQKIEAGVDFIMTQPIYDPDLFASVLARLGPVPVPILMGVLPLQSYRHAEFLHNELPGVELTDDVLQRMRNAGSDGQAEGMKMAGEILDQCIHLVSGVYVMPSFDRYEPAADLVRSIRELFQSRHTAATGGPASRTDQYLPV